MSPATTTPLFTSLTRWSSIPPVVLLSAYFVRKWYLARRLKLYGIGKGGELPNFHSYSWMTVGGIQHRVSRQTYKKYALLPKSQHAFAEARTSALPKLRRPRVPPTNERR